MRLSNYLILVFFIGGCSLLQAQERPVYEVKPLTQEDINRRKAIPEWGFISTRNATELPRGVDNSASKYFPEIFNQRGNSCSQASGTRYAFTYEVNRMLDRDAKDSKENTFSYHFTWNFLNNGIDEGSHPELGYNMIKATGAASLADMPDESASVSDTKWLTGYDKYLRSMTYRVSKYEKFTLKTNDGIERLKQFLYNRGISGSAGGVVTFSCKSSDWKGQTYRGPSSTGIEYIIYKNGTDGAHALTIVGYDDDVEFDINNDAAISDDERGAFIVVNSWGTFWGSKGRCYYPYKLFLTPAKEGGLSDNDAEALMVEPEIHEPKVVFKVNMTYTSRDDLSFRLGVADGDDALYPTVVYGYPVMMNQGGDHPMLGDGTAESFKTIEFAMNFSDKLPDFENFKNPKYFLIVRKIAYGKTTGEGQINSFSVVDYRTNTEYISSQKNVKIGGETTLTTNDSMISSVSSNPYSWLQKDDSTVVKSPFILKTADGKQIKLSFEDYDKESGRTTIKYKELP